MIASIRIGKSLQALVAALVMGFTGFPFFLSSVRAGEAKLPWQDEWDRTVKADMKPINRLIGEALAEKK